MHKMNKKNIRERRDAIIDLYSEGRNQTEIAHRLEISQPTVHRDIRFERERIKNRNDKWLGEQLSFEYNACTVGLNKILRYAWDIVRAYDNSTDHDTPTSPPTIHQMNMDTHKKLMNALNLAKSCYETKIELLGDDRLIKDILDVYTNLKSRAHDDDMTYDEHLEMERRRRNNIQAKF